MKGGAAALALRAHPEGVSLALRVRPKGTAAAVTGVHAGALRLTVVEAPERGKANDGVRRLLASTLGLPLRSIEVLQGASTQDKVVLLRGLTTEEVRRRLAAALPS